MRALPWLCLLLALPLHAHDGHDHADEGPALVTAVLGPRLSLHSERVELVAAPEGDQWVITVDDYTSNAPLTALTVQVQQGTRQWQAAPDGQGNYRLPVDLLVTDGATPLRFQLIGKGWSEQLHGVLPALPLAPTPGTTAASPPLVWISAALSALLALSALSALAWRVRRRRA